MAGLFQDPPTHPEIQTMSKSVRIDIPPSEHVTAIVYPAASRGRANIRLILAHGAGSNQMTPSMTRMASALAGRGFETVTFNFLYSEQRKRVPDKNDRLEACWRRVIETFTGHKLVIGGKSMGGRIASQVAAADASGIAGLVFLGYPLHPPGKPETLRAKHLPAIRAPLLFVQGAKDAFGTPAELKPILSTLKDAALSVVEDADHSFKVPKRAALPQEKVDEFVLGQIEAWLRTRIVR
jgi:predicted alpha/beta-hydrolase family hydrolase